MNYVILGGGSVTAEYYLPALKIFGARITVVDCNEASLALLRQEFFGVGFVNQDHIAFLKGLAQGGDERIIVALPNHLHVQAVTAALDKGRNILCEKPLSLKSEDCRKLAAQATRAGKVLKVAMSRRFLPSLMLARQMVAAQELGAVRAVEVRDCAPFAWRPRTFAFFDRESGGVLADMGVHYLDYLDTVLGPLNPISYSDDARGGCEASLSYELRAGGIPVNMHLSRLESNGAHIRFDCERGNIRIEKKNELEIFVTPAGRPTRRVAAETPFAVPAWPKDFHGSFCAMLDQFEEGVRGGQTELADGVDAERTAGLIEWAYRMRSMQSSNVRAPLAASHPEILVTGATGFIGGHLVDRLAQEGRGIRATARSTATCANIARYPLEITPLDLLKKDDVEKAVRGVRTVFHLAYGRDGADAAAATIEGTKNIIEAAIAAGVESIVVLSTMYVFGFPSGQTAVDEGFPYRPYGGEYGASKASMERWCLERAKTRGKTRIAVLNPTCVFGPGGAAYTKLPVQLARLGQFCWIDSGSGLCNFTYVENVVDAVLAAATITSAHGQRFIVNDGVLPWRDFLERFVAPLGVSIPNYSAAEFNALPRPSPPFRMRDLISAVLGSREFRDVAKRSWIVRRTLAAMGDERRARFAHASAPVSQRTVVPNTAEKALPPEWLLDLYPCVATTFSAEKARRVLGWAPATPYERARDKTLQWLTEAGYYAQPVG